jgi:hypothetical protein
MPSRLPSLRIALVLAAGVACFACTNECVDFSECFWVLPNGTSVSCDQFDPTHPDGGVASTDAPDARKEIPDASPESGAPLADAAAVPLLAADAGDCMAVCRASDWASIDPSATGTLDSCTSRLGADGALYAECQATFHSCSTHNPIASWGK